MQRPEPLPGTGPTGRVLCAVPSERAGAACRGQPGQRSAEPEPEAPVVIVHQRGRLQQLERKLRGRASGGHRLCALPGSGFSCIQNKCYVVSIMFSCSDI